MKLLARILRKHQTDSETLLWNYLRDRRMKGSKFRRQYPIGSYIVDFVCTDKKVIIELDGGQHAEQEAEDKKRTKYLEGMGYRMVRFWNNQVLNETESVLEEIYLILDTPSPPPSPPMGARE
jgi:very-short-patch-repair endonuclease